MTMFKGDWPAKISHPSQFNFLYSVPVVAQKLKDSQKPFFKMASGGIYAVATTGGMPTHFVNVYKDRRPPKVRKRERREMRRQG